jgi:hypothetical protein
VNAVTSRTDQFGPLTDSAVVERVAVTRRDAASTAPELGAWRIMTPRMDAAALLGSGEAIFDVPFSISEPGGARVLRGTIDCLVRHADGSIAVFAVESGQPAVRHEERLALHLEAARRMFPGAAVNGRTLYCTS